MSLVITNAIATRPPEGAAPLNSLAPLWVHDGSAQALGDSEGSKPEQHVPRRLGFRAVLLTHSVSWPISL